MTKERLYHEMPDEGYHAILDLFFSQNVVIPKGKNRHPYADVLHEWIEGADIEVKLEGIWTDYRCSREYIDKYEYRIKPSEPVYAYRVRMNFKDGSCEYTDKYFTKQEFDDFGFPSSCELAEETKQERKQ